MYKKRCLWPWIACLVCSAVLLSACQPGLSPEPTPTAPVPTQQVKPSPTPFSDTVPVDKLVINEDPYRSGSFNINTLAYELPGMEEVEVVNLTYAFSDDKALTMDIYYPPGTPEEAQLPAVILGMGYRYSKQRLRNEHFYTSWGKLVAAAGMIAIAYDTQQPDKDIMYVMDALRENAAELRVDPDQLGFLSMSANTATVMSVLMQEKIPGVKFSIYYYGLSLTPDEAYKEVLAKNCTTRGCLYADLAPVSYVDPDMPLMVVKAGQDFIAQINEAMDHFIDYVRSEGAQVTVVDYETGVHGFDTEQQTAESAAIIEQTVAFMLEHFEAEPASTIETPTAVSVLRPLVLRNGLVITAAGDDPIPNGVVVVEDGLITAVGLESGITIPEDAIVIDLQGKTVMPGLIDARASDLLNRLEIENGQISFVPLELYLRGFMKLGVTTVRAIGCEWEKMRTIPTLRVALEAHGNTIPSVLIVGTGMAHSESSGYTKYYSDQLVGVGTAEEARQVAEDLIEFGINQVSFAMSTGPSLREAPEDRLPVLTSDQLMAIVDTAHARNKLVVGQAIFADEALIAVNAGVDELLSWPTPIEPMPEELLQAIITRSVPVISGFSAYAPREPDDVRRFLDAGGVLVYGTLGPNSEGTPTIEFRFMQLFDMTPMEMIQSATVNAARVLGMEDTIGTLEVGKQADIVILEGNLLEDNFLKTIGNVVYVVKNGELVVQPE